jgi:hypothetical protein
MYLHQTPVIVRIGQKVDEHDFWRKEVRCDEMAVRLSPSDGIRLTRVVPIEEIC